MREAEEQASSTNNKGLVQLENVLIVLQPDFVKKVDIFLEFLHMGIGGQHESLTKDEFKRRLWQLLKGQWARSPEIFDAELFDNLPDELKNPLLSIVTKPARGQFKLDDGYEIPMYNYGGKLTPISVIPNVLCQIGTCTTIQYTEGGERGGKKDSPNSSLINAMKQYPKN